MIGLDCETEPFAPWLMAPPLVVCTVGDATEAELYTSPAPAWVCLQDDTPIMGLNIAYDLAVLANEDPDLMSLIFRAYDEGRIIDIGIRQRLIDLARGDLGWYGGKRAKYSLAELAKRNLGVELAKDDHIRTTFKRGVPLTPEQDTYSRLDVTTTVQVGERLPPMPDEQRQTASAWWIHLMHCWGMTPDPQAVAEFTRMAQANYDRLSAALVDIGLKRPDRIINKGKPNMRIDEGARDTKNAMALLVAAYERQGKTIPLSKGSKNPDGSWKSEPRPKLDDEACQRSGDTALQLYAEFSSASKVLSSDVELLTTRKTKQGDVPRAPYEPIHANFNVLLETGDIGCSNPNLVNLPTTALCGRCYQEPKRCQCDAPEWRGVRECFVPRPGFVYLACDYSQIQLHTWGQACINLFGYSDMAEALNAKKCAHTMIAADILGIAYEEAKSRPNKQGKPNTIYYERQCGKVVSYGRPGGMGIARLIHAAANQYGVDIDEPLAKRLCKTWERRWREGRPYLEYVRSRTAGGKAILEQFYSKRIRGGLGYCDLANGIFSALSYDILKDAGWLVAKACYNEPDSVLYGSRIINAIHDELLLEVPEDRGHECADEVSRLMRLGAEKWIPDVPAVVEATLMRRWSKLAGPVYENGRLVPFET